MANETMTLISTQSMSGTTGVDFLSLPQSFTDLVLVISARSNQTGTSFGAINFWVNSNRSGYTEKFLRGTGSAVTSYTDSAASNWALDSILPAASSTSNTFSNVQIYFPNYTSSATKSISMDSVSENNATAAYQSIGAGIWTGTSAITSISLEVGTYPNTWATGSMASLYGVLKGSGGATVA